MKTITICSDDFGLNEAINKGILSLVFNNRIQAVSILTLSNDWKKDATKLLEFSHQIDLGVHLNLTENLSIIQNNPKGLYGLSELLIKAHLRLIDKNIIKTEFKRQIDAFTNLTKRLPDFLDGHQHVHAFPIVSEALIEIVNEYWPNNKNLYIRDTSKVILNLDYFFIKKLILSISCKTLNSKLKENQIRYPKAFSGVYNFHPNTNFAHRFNQWLKNCIDGTLFMCHPSFIGSNDSIHKARIMEFEYFNSPRFIEDCSKNQIILKAYKNHH